MADKASLQRPQVSVESASSPTVETRLQDKPRGKKYRTGWISRFSIFPEIWYFLMTRKKWWLGPILVVLAILAVTLFWLLLVSETAVVFAPLIYPFL